MLGAGADLLVRGHHPFFELGFNFGFTPPTGLVALHPLEVGDQDAPGVREDARDDQGPVACEDDGVSCIRR